MNIVGYSDRLSVERDDEIAFMVSTDSDTYHAEVVRLFHGDDSPLSPGFKSEYIPSSLDGDHKGIEQVLLPGSYIRIPHRDEMDLSSSFTIQLWMWPTTPEKRSQTLFSQRGPDVQGVALRLEDGNLRLTVGNNELTLHGRIETRMWHFVSAVYDAQVNEMRLPLEREKSTRPKMTETARGAASGVPTSSSDLLIGGEEMLDDNEPVVGNFYNGKIEAPHSYNVALSEHELVTHRDANSDILNIPVIAKWDFPQGIGTWSNTDSSGNGFHGHAVNMPMRAATGRNWDGTETSWRNAPHQYGAVHFHDDDLSDAKWEKSVKLKIPPALPSGIYALHVTAGTGTSTP